MSQIVTTSQSSTSVDLFNISAADEAVLVLPGVILTALNAQVFETTAGASDFHLTLYGMAASVGGPVVISNGARASILVAGSGVLFADAATQAGLLLAGPDSALVNQGEITVNGTYAIWASQDGASVTNWGSIAGQRAAIMTDGQGSAFVNYGSVTATGTLTSGSAYALHSRYAAQTLQNHGHMTATGPGGAEVVHIVSPDLRIENHGLMNSSAGWAIGGQLGTGTRLSNWGVIAGYDAGTGAVMLDAAPNAVLNRGSILGLVDLGEGSDTLDNRGGTIEGQILGGYGDDVFFVSSDEVQIVENTGEGFDRLLTTVSLDLADFANIERLELRGSAVQGIGTAGSDEIAGFRADNRIYGLAGDDSLWGGHGDDTADGGAGADWIYGGLGEDSLLGDLGVDQLYGGLGNDTLSGGAENDRLEGEEGDDYLIGGAGADRLLGQDGADTLWAGDGRDSLYGGAGQDVFLYSRAAESRNGTSQRDSIYDFEPGIDRLDLAAIDANPSLAGDQAFVWRGNAAFQSVAGELRWQVSGSNVTLLADLTGDAMADMEILVLQLTSFALGDLVL